MLKITLKAARVNSGLNLKEAAELFGIHHETLSKYEKDSTDIPRSLIMKVEENYKVPLENIFFGKQSDFFRIIKTREHIKATYTLETSVLQSV